MARPGDSWDVTGMSRERLMREPGKGRCLHPIRIEPERLGRSDRDAGQQCAQAREQVAIVAPTAADIDFLDFVRQRFDALRDGGGG
jgi:hypothetical protein